MEIKFIFRYVRVTLQPRIALAHHFLAIGLMSVFLLLYAVPTWAQTSAQADIIDGGTVNEGENATRVVIIKNETLIAVPVTIYWIAIPETATTDDYGVASGSVILPAYATESNPIIIPITDDNLSEGEETFLVQLTHYESELWDKIQMEDTPLRFTIPESDPIAVSVSGDGSVAEGAVATYTVSLTGGTATEDLAVDYATSDDTATAGVDYTEVSGTLTFAVGETQKTVTVQTVQDDLSETGETFTFSISNALGGGATPTIGNGTVTTAIINQIVEEPNEVPTFNDAISDQLYTVGTEIPSLTLPEGSGGDGDLTYSLTPLPPSGLRFHSAIRVLSGTPSVSQVAGEYTYVVTDSDGDTAELLFDIAVRPARATGLMAEAGNAQVILEWSDPNDDGISGWQVRQSVDGGTSWGIWKYIPNSNASTTGHTVSGLTNGMEYTFQVRAFTGRIGTMRLYGDASNPASATPMVPDKVPTFGDDTGDPAYGVIDDQLYTVGTRIPSLTLPEGSGGDGALTYSLTPSLPGGLRFHSAIRVLSGTPSVSQVAGEYTYVVTDSDGDTAELQFDIAVRPAGVTDLIAMPDDAQVILAWSDPADSGISGWQVRQSTDGGTTWGGWTVVKPRGTGTLFYYIVSELINGAEYTFQVRAFTGSMGTTRLYGDASNPASATPMVPDKVPTFGDDTGDPPYGVIDDQLYTVGTEIPGLTLPEARGGDGALTYRLAPLPPAGLSFNATVLSGTPIVSQVAGEYTYVVTDSDGDTAELLFDIAVRPARATGLMAEAGNAQVTLRWSDPNDNGIGGWQVRQSADGGTSWGIWKYIPNSNASTTGHTVSSLLNGMEYTFEVRAFTGGMGSGRLYGNASNPASATPMVPDKVPTFGDDTGDPAYGVIDDQLYTVGTRIPSLTLPEGSGGDGALTYSLTPSLPGGLRFHSATRVLSGTPIVSQVAGEYTYVVTDSDGDTAELLFDIAVRPAKATGLMAEAGNAQVTLRWTDPNDSGIGGWQVRQSADGGTSWGDWTDIANSIASMTDHTVLSLTNGAEYTFEVRAFTGGIGTTRLYGDASNPASATPMVPDKVPVFDDVIGDQVYTVGTEIPGLTLPEARGGDGALTYSLMPLSPPGLSFNPIARVLSGTPSAPQAASECIYTVVDSDLRDPDSATLTFFITINAAVPSPPENLKVAGGDEQLRVSWDAPADNGSAIVFYTVQWKQAGAITYPPENTIRTEAVAGVITGLTSGQEYVVRVNATNGVGTGNWSEETRGKVNPRAPTTVVGVSVVSSPGSAGVYITGDAIEVRVVFGEPVTVTGSPQLSLLIGEAVRSAVLVAGDAGPALTFRYVVKTGDYDVDGIGVMADALLLNGGAIVDTAGNAVVLSLDIHAFDTAAAHRVDARVPVVTGTLPALHLVVGGDKAFVDARDVFSGPMLVYTFVLDNTEIASIQADDRGTAWVTPLREGESEVTVTARNANGEASLSFAVLVSTSAEEVQMLEDVLAAQGRVLLSSVVDVIGNRFRNISCKPVRQAVKSKVARAAGAVSTELAAVARFSNALGSGPANYIGSQTGTMDTRSGALENGIFHDAGWAPSSAVVFDRSYKAFLNGLFQPFALTLDGEKGGEGRVLNRWTLWGAGDVHRFNGRRDAGHYDGDLESLYLGIDGRLNAQWLAGVSVSRSLGTGDYVLETADVAGEGQLETELVSVYPYLRGEFANGLGLWALGGVGQGEATHHRVRVVGVREASPLRLHLGAAGLRQCLLSAGGANLSVVGDGGFVRLATDGGSEAVANLDASVQRVRLGMEVLQTIAFLNGRVVISPFAQVSGRYDGGDGVTGKGMDLVAGMRYGSPRVTFEVRGRWLGLYSELDYHEEYGASARLEVKTYRDGTGLKLAVTPQWGAPAGGGAEALWGDGALRTAHGGAEQGSAVSLNGEVGYGLRFHHGAVTPFLAYGRRGAQQEHLHMGVGYTSGLHEALRWQFTLERERTEFSGIDHQVELRLTRPF